MLALAVEIARKGDSTGRDGGEAILNCCGVPAGPPGLTGRDLTRAFEKAPRAGLALLVSL